MLLLLMLLTAVLSQDHFLPRSCTDVSSPKSGVYRLYPEYGFGDPIDVYCDQAHDGGGWIVIQNRFDGSVNFYRGWSEYEKGFGDWRSEFWLGLKTIHRITYSQRFELLIRLEDFENVTKDARYDYFVVSGPEDGYRLKNLGAYSGSAGDSLSPAKDQQFSTLDRNTNSRYGNAGAQFQGAWWYNWEGGNLNGLYLKAQQSDYAIMMCWRTFRGYHYGLKTSRMMIRPLQSTNGS
ncbi:microfibril-associated glycoprotein 4-like [Uranotaenia lowii]|uniref:microfibril-associated glycoprotein 4-like n=1 Tax=Uranotaenia lowii TaxID=190385 RepID=UPI0024798D7D|nr:microfibril-associated glycoprotein 4-like [Uranotaenia lowii]